MVHVPTNRFKLDQNPASAGFFFAQKQEPRANSETFGDGF
ncbi:hypothetical protein CFter6_4609 [Collimonas fungivorans]|uniref:Uncharacterized protein n=1 Tax=Collimonas fungivorans TaxID=158899 RepID=A0A127PHI1_9BURK|nr:hypothetical protein CFter6_4609 [Collimonas fungivorans]